MRKQENSWGTILFHAWSQHNLAFRCKNALYRYSKCVTFEVWWPYSQWPSVVRHSYCNLITTVKTELKLFSVFRISYNIFRHFVNLLFNNVQCTKELPSYQHINTFILDKKSIKVKKEKHKSQLEKYCTQSYYKALFGTHAYFLLQTHTHKPCLFWPQKTHFSLSFSFNRFNQLYWCLLIKASDSIKLNHFLKLQQRSIPSWSVNTFHFVRKTIQDLSIHCNNQRNTSKTKLHLPIATFYYRSISHSFDLLSLFPPVKT